MKKVKSILFVLIILALLGVFGYSGLQVWDIYSEYWKEDEVHQEMMQYKPDDEAPVTSEGGMDTPITNQNILDMQAKYPDALGWITIDGTKIDYPFVQSLDNDKYLRRDMDLNDLYSGTIFVDYRNNPAFSDFTTIIYGHNMKNGSMFGTLDKFREKDFFEANRTGRIYLPHATLNLEIVAAVDIKSSDEEMYLAGERTEEEKQKFLDYVTQKAEHIQKGAQLKTSDRYVLLSTCIYDYDEARLVVLAKIS